MKATNQMPQILQPIATIPTTGDFEPLDSLKEVLIEPIYTPIHQSLPAQVLDDNNNDITVDDAFSMMMACMGEDIDPDAEEKMKEFYQITLLHFDQGSTLSVQNLFTIQSAVAAKLPLPPKNVIYTADADVIPMAKAYLTQTCTYDEYFASLALFAKVDALGFQFLTTADFNEFKTWLDTEVQKIKQLLPNETIAMFDNFQQNVKLDNLTESFILRQTETDNNDELSFARMIVNYLMQYTQIKPQHNFAVLPFRTDEVFVPRTIILVNTEQHAKATGRAVTKEWQTITQALQNPPTILSRKQITQLTAAQRAANKMKQRAMAAMRNAKSTQRSVRAPFSKTKPTSIDLAKRVTKLLSKMAKVNHSQNSFKQESISFMVANRRNPDDFNKAGKSTAQRYRPDIHLYVDTSGSISERDYQDAVKACIMLARKLNVNLYFNSFSDVISQQTCLTTKGRSVAQIYKQVQRIPKVTGGTDFTEVWQYIQMSKKRRRELSLMITDFGFYLPNRGQYTHPRNLYYAPCSTISWDWICDEAQRFCNSAMRVEPNIRKHLLF